MKRLIYALAVIAILLMSSCIKEAYEECNIQVKLLFSYFGDGTKQIFIDKNQKVNLYVYDSSNKIVLKQEIDYAKLLEFQGTYLDLPAGDYTIVCWGNVLDHTNMEAGSGSYSGSKVGHFQNTKDNQYAQPIDSLYYGTYKLNVPSTHKLIKDTLIQDIIPFQSAHIKFQIAVKECTTKPNKTDLSGKYNIVMGDLPASDGFNKVAHQDVCQYLLTLDKRVGSAYYTEFNTLRFPNDNDIKIKLVDIQNNNKVVHEINLKQFLIDNKIDVEKYQEVKVPILIEVCDGGDDPDGSGDLIVTVRVAVWDGEHLDVDIE